MTAVIADDVAAIEGAQDRARIRAVAEERARHIVERTLAVRAVRDDDVGLEPEQRAFGIVILAAALGLPRPDVPPNGRRDRGIQQWIVHASRFVIEIGVGARERVAPLLGVEQPGALGL